MWSSTLPGSEDGGPTFGGNCSLLTGPVGVIVLRSEE